MARHAVIWEGLGPAWPTPGYVATDCDKPNHYEITSQHVTFGPAPKSDGEAMRLPTVVS